MANILSGVNVLMAMTMPMVGWIISSKQLSAARLQGAVTQEFRNEKGQLISTSPADKCIMLIRTSSILQLATLEGSAFLGLAVCLIVTTEGVAQAEPAYLFNMATCLPLFGFIVATFPTRASFTNIFETKIQNNR